MRSTYNILFYINRNKQKKNGLCPIMGRITVDGKLTQFSIKEDIDPNKWSVKEGCSTGRDKEDRELNQKLTNYQKDLKAHYNRLVERNAYVTAEGLKSELLNTNTHEVMLLEEFKAHNAAYLKSVGILKSKGSYYGYQQACNTLEKFITHKYGLADIAFKQLQYSFIADFDFYLRVDLNLATDTIFNVIHKLKRMVHRAINKEIIRKNPFADFKCKQAETSRKWLSKEELDTIMQTPMKNKQTEFVRVMFIFSVFTGLAFADLYNLKQENISTDNSGITWIRFKRKKTGTESIVPLLDIPLGILKKYGNRKTEGKVFDLPYYALVRSCLQEIRTITKLKTLKFHMSRHSYATQICLTNGVPIETLSRMMGHKNISTTQIYAKITNQKVDADMQALEKRLGNKYQLGSTSLSSTITTHIV